MPTNILLLPLYKIEVETATNEDALGSFAFESGEPLAPLGLDGIDFRLQLRTSAANASVHLEGSIANGRVAIGRNAEDTANNVLVIAVDQTAMARLAPLDYAWDVLALADGYERRVFFGTWRHRLGVTKP